MLDRQLIRENPEEVRKAIARKGLSAPVDDFMRVDGEFRAVTVEMNEAQAESNRISKTIGQLIGVGKNDEAEAAKVKTGELKNRVKELEQRHAELEAELHQIELRFPNMPHASIPDGATEAENKIVRMWGDLPNFAEPPKQHQEICLEHGLVDFERASKISGSGFAVYTGYGARMVRALVNYMLDVQTGDHGYAEVYPPVMVNAESLVGTGNLPKFEEDLYKANDGLYLIPTAEVPVTNLYRDEILDGTELPMKMAAYSTCFRREAGAAGRDTRGILRMHQFDKVELVNYVLPEDSYDALERLIGEAEAILQNLGLHYRVIELCAGDIGDKGCKCYDLEVWAPGEGRYLEVSSCTNFEAYQARRANIRFRREPGAKPEFVHILNGSGLAVPRLMVALLETYRLSNGDIVVPEPLHRYMGTELITLNG
jgi:seryl-tRNA synthetase